MELESTTPAPIIVTTAVPIIETTTVPIIETAEAPIAETAPIPIIETAPSPIVGPIIIKPVSKPRKRVTGCHIFSRANSRTKCKICGFSFKRNYIKSHMKYVHGDYLSQCALCSKCFNRPDCARNHLAQNHGISTDEVKNHVKYVMKKDVPPELHPVVKTLVVKPKPAKQKASYLETVKVFNCFDCPESFPYLQELFYHCNIHRLTEDGQKYPILVPPKLIKRNFL